VKSCFARNYDFPFSTHFQDKSVDRPSIQIVLEPHIEIKGERIHHAPDYPGGPCLDLFYDQQHYFIHYDDYDVRLEKSAIYLSGPTHNSIRITQVLERVILPLHLYLCFPHLIPLHGGALLFNKHAYIFIGASGAGKSTTLSELLDRGATLLSDDMVFINANNGALLPSLPTLRLLEAREQNVRHLARVGPKIQKWWHLLAQTQEEKEHPVKTLFILSPSEELFRCEKVCGFEKFGALLSQSFALQTHNEIREQKRFNGLSQIANTISVERLHFKKGNPKPIHIDLLCDYLRQ